MSNITNQADPMSRTVESEGQAALDQLKSMVEEARAALSLAVTIGLAAHYDERRKELNKELEESRNTVTFAARVLFALLLPFFVITGYPVFFPDQSIVPTGLWDTILATISRIAIAVPGIWYLSFCIKRHQTLFRLREHYSHRFSVAHSFEGIGAVVKGENEQIQLKLAEALMANQPEEIWGKKGSKSTNSEDISDLKATMQNFVDFVPTLKK